MSNISNIKNLFTDYSGAPNAVLRQKAFDQFEMLGLPTRFDEDWKYTSLKSLANNWQLPKTNKVLKTKIADNALTIYSLNGEFDLNEIQNALSEYKIEVLNTNELLENYENAQALQKNSFWHLNHAFLNQGLLLKVSDRTHIEIPVIIEHVIDGDGIFVNPFVAISLGKDSTLDLCEKFTTTSSAWINSSSTISLKEGSRLNCYKLYDHVSDTTHIDNNYIEQMSFSTLRMVSIGKGSQVLRSDIHAEVLGSQAHTDLRGLALLKNKDQMDHNIQVHHVSPESTSRQLFKSILKNESHYVFKGNVRIEKEAQKTDADQLNKNLLMDKKARVDTRPQIDVFADDVKATHGAAIGQINSEEKFYLESRCISPDLAQKILCEGYAREVLENLSKTYLNNVALSFIQGGLDV